MDQDVTFVRGHSAAVSRAGSAGATSGEFSTCRHTDDVRANAE